MDKAQYISRVRQYLDAVLLTDQTIALACDAGLDCADALDVLYPLVTKKGIPFLAQNQLYSACSDPRKTVAFLAELHEALAELVVWNADRLNVVVKGVAESHKVSMETALQICKASILFGNSPLDPFSSMEAIGQEATCGRCDDAANLLTSSLMVG